MGTVLVSRGLMPVAARQNFKTRMFENSSPISGLF
jgi:hypothetical protein